MRAIYSEKVERGRILSGDYGSIPGKPYGAFLIRGPTMRELTIIVDPGDESGWEHVSVSLSGRKDRCPTWPEMVFVKDLFWTDEETVIQYHPARKHYVNFHPGVLHLWRKKGQDFELPPEILVGPK